MKGVNLSMDIDLLLSTWMMLGIKSKSFGIISGHRRWINKNKFDYESVHVSTNIIDLLVMLQEKNKVIKLTNIDKF